MKFLLNEKEKKKINNLIETRNYNNKIAEYLNNYVIGQKIEEVDYDDEINMLSNLDFIVNEFNNIHEITIRNSQYKLCYEKYLKSEIFLSDEINVDSNDYFVIKNNLGYFPNDYKYLCLKKDDEIWMSIIPHEINTMKFNKNIISNRVYIFGLGLGYFPKLISPYVDEIYIIENDGNIISIFEEFILPKLQLKCKIIIIKEDALKFNNFKDLNDFVFVDLYHNAIDGMEIYFNLKRSLKNTNCQFWIEESIIAAFRNLIINLIEEELYFPNKFEYKPSESFIDNFIYLIHEYFKNYEIKSYEKIKEILLTKNIKNLICSL